MDENVLIVGAGPTGLMLANQLARRGVRPIVIDRHLGPAQQTRAMAVHARTLEIYASMGVAKEALRRGMPADGANLWVDGKWGARIPLGDIGQGISPYPFVLMLGQDENEHILGDNLTKLGVAIQWRSELVALTQSPGHVDVTVKQPDGSTREIRVAWVAGCDGSRSAVRQFCGIEFPGAPYEHTFFVADTVARGPMKPGALNAYLWRDGFHLLFPMEGEDRWRVIGILPQHLRATDSVTFEELAPHIRRQAGAGIAFAQCSWFSTYRIQHRAAAHFRRGRCFLLGDAAHIHSPAGGQGMNTGLQDAYNLGWKLALVIAGYSDQALLDSYEEERLPVARRLLETTDRAFQLVVADNWFARLLRTRILVKVASRAMTIERARKLAFQTISQTGISYRASSLSRTFDGIASDAPRAGDRFPWLRLQLADDANPEDLYESRDDTRFSLLVFGQPAPAATAFASFGNLLDVRTVPSTLGNPQALSEAHIPAVSFYLLRPDGHVALCGATVTTTQIEEYLYQQIHLTPMAGRRGSAAQAGRTTIA